MADVQVLYDRMMGAIERPLKRRIIREKNRYIRASSLQYAKTEDLPSFLLEEHEDNLRKILEVYWKRSMRIFTVDTFKRVRKLKQLDAEETYLLFFQEWLDTEAGAHVRNIASTTRDDVIKIVEASLNEGVSGVAVAERILNARGLSPFRAETIARTEVHNAGMFASKRSASLLQDDLGVQMVKKWVPAKDERTRENHAVMSRHKPIPLDEKFIVGGQPMDRPGDPVGGPSNVINCRCVLTYEIIE